MKKKKLFILFGLVIVAVIAVFITIRIKQAKGPGEVSRVITPAHGDIFIYVSTTGTVEPQNRLEIKPTISGRVEEILVREGDRVTAGETLALMSSTERATLLDAARLQDEKTFKYWEEAYKPSPLIAPIDGKVIVRAVEPGQTVTANSPILVLSDRLIVKAQVDETDIGRVKLGQRAVISLDAYPETEIAATVDHIAYESKTVNNVTIYEVDILPERVPEVFRSGMSANVEIIEKSRENVLILPAEAVKQDKRGSFVLVRSRKETRPQPRRVELGLSDGTNVEIISGLRPGETVLVTSRSYSPSKNSRKGGGPLTPWGRRRKKK